ncbi:MAG TPA: glycosyltransferase family 2 protein [Candidatus Pacearchaeota archaeon]|nr:MAG: hypothetical protein YFSK_5830 [Candidatus Yanofskybacteria bacterium]HNR81360.1 glycosyltransferase family 2 protein [Candidatus Pacearchaeota archaeon]
MDKTNLSIVIVNHNARQLLRQCLESIKNANIKSSHEIIVVDNNSRDGSQKMLKEEFGGVIRILNNENLFFGKANNQGARISRGKYILFLNPDTIVMPDSIDTMVKFLENNPKVWGVGPKLCNFDGTVQYGFYRKFPSIISLLLFYTPLMAISKKSKFLRRNFFEDMDFSKAKQVQQPPGAALLVRREIIDKIGGYFDEDFHIWYEDVDLAFRVKKAGGRLYVVPEAEIRHVGGHSFTPFKMLDRRLQFLSSLKLFLKKHRGALVGKMFFLFVYFGALVLASYHIITAPFVLGFAFNDFSNKKRLQFEKINDLIRFLFSWQKEWNKENKWLK